MNWRQQSKICGVWWKSREWNKGAAMRMEWKKGAEGRNQSTVAATID
jgi:hypothetical protein